MKYSLSLTSEIKSKVITIICSKLDIAFKNDRVQEFLDKYDFDIKFDDNSIIEEEYMPIERNKAKILVFGALAGNIKDYYGVVKELGISKEHIEFNSDYDKLKNVDVEKYRYSNIYSDIIFGPTPHKQVGMGDTSSFLAKMKNNPSEYPKAIVAKANGQLKLSISSFKEALSKTRYYNKIVIDC